MNIAEWAKEDRLTLARIAQGIGVANTIAVSRYKNGSRIPDRERMRALVIFSEGRVTPNDVYGLGELIALCLEQRARRLDRRKTGRADQPELPLEAAA